MAVSPLAVEAIEKLRRENTHLILGPAGMWTTPDTPRERRPELRIMAPTWYIRIQSVVALEALGYLRRDKSSDGSVCYVLTSKGKKGKIKI